jgi:glycosyltransferase involved in cell wall biosynthesis
MKIGYFSHTAINISETFIYDLIVGLNEKSDNFTFYSGKKRLPQNYIKNQIATGYSEYREGLSYKYYKLGQVFGGKGNKWKMAFQKKSAFKMLNRIPKSNLPDIAYIEYATSAVYLRAFLEFYKIPYIVHVHGYDITSSLVDRAYQNELYEVYKNASCIITASNYMKRLLVLNGCSEEKIKVIRLGLNAISIHQNEWKNRIKTPPSVIFLGRLTQKKHPIALLHAFRIVVNQIPEALLSIIGDGELKNEVHKTVKTLKLENNVNLLGALSREKSFPILNEHWVYAQHSVTALSGDQEGFAISPAEAALHELPVVSTIHNGIPEHVIDGVTGFLVPEFHYEMMAEKIIYLLKNPDICEQMGKAGRLNITNMCNPENRIEKIYNLLEKYARQ